MTLDEILVEIKQAENIVILTHESPDGDAIGSSLAMKKIIEKIGKSADVIIPEIPRLYSYLPSVNEVKKESNIQHYDLGIAVDCADLKRLSAREYFENSKKTISIDHHGSNKMFADLNFVNPVSPACCEVLAGMLGYYKIEIDKEIGTCLMTGIITDTGGFRHQGITPETFEFTADLIRIGVDVPEIYKNTLCTKSKANFQLTKKIMDRMELLENGKIAFTYINTKDLEEVEAEPGDHEGLVDIGQNIEGVEVSIFIRQKENEEAYKVSMRSTDKVNSSDVCLMFGGGGHARAAGVLIQGNVEQVKDKIVKEVIKALIVEK